MSKNDQEHYEEELQRHEKRLSRGDRKVLRAKDRSKYKKTDVDQQVKSAKPFEATEGALRGRVLSITGEYIEVASEEGHVLPCVLRGALKKEKQRVKNLITVGDFVHYLPCDGGEGMIADVEPRKTVLSRADNLDQQKEHLIAANVDLVLITVSVVHPPLKTNIIDRYIIASDRGGMDYAIVVNKIDMIQNPDEEVERYMFEEAQKAYAIAGIPFFGVSASTGEGMDRLMELMKGKASVFSGQSGVGKSSLINTLTGSNLPTREGVQRTKKGSHTTTTAILLPLPCGGWIVDTPGIRSFGLWEIDKSHVAAYFDEIIRYAPGCAFANCTHTHEEKCAVIAAVEEDKIHPFRYQSYCAILEQLEEEHHRR